MKWFEKHLNWAAVFVSLLLLALIGVFYLGFRHYWGGSSCVQLAQVNSLIRVPAYCSVLLCIIAIAICYGWVISRKNRSPAFLLFFIPVFATGILFAYFRSEPTTYIFLSQHVTWDIVYPGEPLVIIFVNSLILLVSGITLIRLKNKTRVSTLVTDNQSNPPPKTYWCKRWDSRYFQSKKALKYSFIVLFCLAAVCSVFAVLFFHHGQITYRFTLQPDQGEKSSLSFRYPASYTEPYYYLDTDVISTETIKYQEIDVQVIILEQAFSMFPNKSAAVCIYDKETTNTLKKVFGDSENALLYILYGKTSLVDDIKTKITDTSIAGFPARKIIDNIYFERDEKLWLIMGMTGINLDETNEAFYLLVDTLQIQDN
jgi:hypothetical protein